MTSGEYARLKELFFAALERPEAERSAFLETACGGDVDLHRRLLTLLEAAHEGDGFLEAPPVLPAEPVDGLDVGSRLGAWEIVREIGQGGMGTVYEVRRAEGDFARRAAVKVVRPEIATAFFLRRFREERRILAGLDHPNIARLLDAGATPEGLPYVVLEFVEGEPMLAHCAARGLDLATRLRLFRQVCAGVEHAHRNLVVHRDLKPSNVLVTAEGVPKLLDFGIAKLLEPENVPGPEGTATLFRLMTPDYASPEQFVGGPITTATDVYSLGVLLYELLTGRRPYGASGLSASEMARVVAESDPLRPSTFDRRLRGDLETIVLKAMQKDPARRYGSAAELGEDITRHLEGLPVRARPDRLGYRLAKFARRHRVGVAAVGAAAAALLAGSVAVVRQTQVARAERARAERRFQEVRSLAHAVVFDLHDAIAPLPGSTRARELLVRKALEYLDGLAREGAGDPSLAREIAAAYRRVGDVQGNIFQSNLGDTTGARVSYRKAASLLEGLASSKAGSSEDRRALADVWTADSQAAIAVGDTAGALESARQALGLRERLAAEGAGDVERGLELALARHFLAYAFSQNGDGKRALESLRREAELLTELLTAAPGDARLLRRQALCDTMTAAMLTDLGDHSAAVDLFRRAAELQQKLLAADRSNAAVRRDLSFTEEGLGGALLDTGDQAGAVAARQRAVALRRELGAADAQSADARLILASACNNLGWTFTRTGRSREALDVLEEGLALAEEAVRRDAANVWARVILAELLDSFGQAHAALADRRNSAAGKRESLESARSSCAKSREILLELERQGRLSPRHRRELEEVSRNLASVETRLASLDRGR